MTTQVHGQHRSKAHPAWWTDEHTAAWERDREALRATVLPADPLPAAGAGYFEAFRGVLSADVLNLKDSGTAEAAAGSAPTAESWRALEPAVRLGHGAYSHYGAEDVGFEAVEARLRADWEATQVPQSWAQVRDKVRHGWEWAQRNLDDTGQTRR